MPPSPLTVETIANPMYKTKEEVGKEFDERFNNNPVYWQELMAEIQIGDPDFKSVESFIHSIRLADVDACIETVEGLRAVVASTDNTFDSWNAALDSALSKLKELKGGL